jgi:hypothetical protein
MAQHPEKLRWKEEHPYGLSASQFGMALGFCGRVSDYVHYLRHIVGTEKEFKGNEFTAHGISTEPKSRSLYELLTGCQVHNGGFFVTEDRILGCSPDGQVFLPASETLEEVRGPLNNAASPAELNGSNESGVEGQLPLRRSTGCSVRVPFKSKRRARSPCSSTTLPSTNSLCGCTDRSSCDLRSPTAGAELTSPLVTTRVSSSTNGEASSLPPSSSARQRVRLLEIKSPFRALYGSTKAGYECFGIPLHYMCQIQGQLAIADCEECDFFVYVDHPSCQVEAWRVRRSRVFWGWAEPNLRQVSAWVKDGPPDWLNRTFAFPPFDFSRIDVAPLVFPYDITARAALTDARRFSFFARFPSPYEGLKRHRGAHDGESGAAESSPAPPAQRRVQQWCHDYCGKSWAELPEHEQIALAVQTPVVRHLFDTNDSDERAERGGRSDGAHTNINGTFLQTLSSWRRVLEAEGCYEKSATAVLWRSLLSTACAGRDPLVVLVVAVPEDWEGGRATVQCTLLPPEQGPTIIMGNADGAFADTTSLPFFRRFFLASLVSASAKALGSDSARSPVASIESPHAYAATPLPVGLPVFMASQPSQGTATSEMRRRLRGRRENTSPPVSYVNGSPLTEEHIRVAGPLSLHSCRSPAPRSSTPTASL